MKKRCNGRKNMTSSLESNVGSSCGRRANLKRNRFRREITQRADARQKKVRTSAHGHELRNAGCAFAYAVRLWLAELIRTRATEKTRAASEQRIFLVLESGKLSI